MGRVKRIAWSATGRRPGRDGSEGRDAFPEGRRVDLRAGWLLGLALLGTVAFGTDTPSPSKPGEGAPFQPLVYTLDLLIPLGGLGQRTAWYWTDGVLQLLAHLLIAAGWVLTTAAVAGVTRTVQKG
ncbi:hypothetical protein [Streptomyces sp. NPDC047981]|uniref:hypothetical protein n=1 Tax=Streptomyces sp. NPDC047981 TaxID=3154610 RepID=UPI0034385778